MSVRAGVVLVVCLLMVIGASAARAELASSGYQNVVSKSIIVPGMTIRDYNSWGQRPGWLPVLTGSHPKPLNHTFDAADLPDPGNIPGVYQYRPRDIVIFSSKRRN
ncbi:MAG TPA: hypothetical protein DGT21_09085 [Armatimonadetes bacterium]|jgi:hypothetical protein|nr:hypothetical protein [Armatimonadota bacterium]